MQKYTSMHMTGTQRTQDHKYNTSTNIYMIHKQLLVVAAKDAAVCFDPFIIPT